MNDSFAEMLQGHKYELSFDPPLLNAAGSLGFAPPAGLDLSPFGAFITNPISLKPRTPAHGRRYLAHPGGFLLHTGYPNPGLDEALQRFAPLWSRAELPVIVHLIPQTAAEAGALVRRLEGLENVAGIELGIPPGLEAPACRHLVDAAQGELPLLARLPLDQAPALAEAALAGGASYISLGAPRACLALDGEEKPALLEGRWYGPGVFPLALQAVRSLARWGLPVIGGGGVSSVQDAQAMLQGGAIAVQVDSALWKKGWVK